MALTRDIDLHFEEFGSGTPLLLLHGNGEDSSYFAHQIPFLSKRYRVLAIDSRGHGASPRGSAPFTLEQFSQDVEALMDKQDIPAAHILGFSDGANIALMLALRVPHRVKSLVLNGGNLFPEGLLAEVRAQDARAFERAKAVGDERQMELLRLMMDEPHLNPADLGRIQAPTLVVAGTRDMIAASHTTLIARSIPGAQLRFVEGDHFVAAGNPKAFNDVLGAFYDMLLGA